MSSASRRAVIRIQLTLSEIAAATSSTQNVMMTAMAFCRRVTESNCKLET